MTVALAAPATSAAAPPPVCDPTPFRGCAAPAQFHVTLQCGCVWTVCLEHRRQIASEADVDEKLIRNGMSRLCVRCNTAWTVDRPIVTNVEELRR